MKMIVLRYAAAAILAAGALQAVAAVAPNLPAPAPTEPKGGPSIPPPFCPTYNGCPGHPY